jgi:hypothetical protein
VSSVGLDALPSFQSLPEVWRVHAICLDDPSSRRWVSVGFSMGLAVGACGVAGAGGEVVLDLAAGFSATRFGVHVLFVGVVQVCPDPLGASRRRAQAGNLGPTRPWTDLKNVEKMYDSWRAVSQMSVCSLTSVTKLVGCLPAWSRPAAFTRRRSWICRVEGCPARRCRCGTWS